LAEGSISSFKNKINIVGSLISAYFLQVLDWLQLLFKQVFIYSCIKIKHNNAYMTYWIIKKVIHKLF
jgi:hypothetical protein